MKESFKEISNYIESFYQQHSQEDALNIAQKIITLQEKLKGAVKVRSLESMLRMLKKGNVFYARNNENEIVFSLYLEPFKSKKLGQIYIVGGLTSVDTQASIKYHRLWLEGSSKFKKEIILARTSPKVAKVFAIPVNMKEVTQEYFNQYIKEEYINYMRKDNPDYILDESEKMYIYKPN